MTTEEIPQSEDHLKFNVELNGRNHFYMPHPDSPLPECYYALTLHRQYILEQMNKVEKMEQEQLTQQGESDHTNNI